jgi:predicted aldo/keto reductase-like oxidoreductase
MERIKKNFGFGFMRLPMKDGEVDTAQTCQMVDAFLDERGSTISTQPMAILTERASGR